ncbi:MAG: class I SAM-dependent methyltransferase [Sorangiineae bacterium]|nr:class I SAM-dependent methyltransferase [Polyangiaceae bacterium]MEB2324524.1 class I SAM-dependent methyltransferase [Sorangiineae bacterium]
MKQQDWDERYRSGQTPWDTGVADAHLVGYLERSGLARGRALDVGCGTGTNAIYLAEHGFEVVGVDLSPLAIERARSKSAGLAGLALHSLSFLDDEVPGGPFDLVYDRGVFHIFDEASERARFAERVAQLLADGGRWVSLIASTEGPPREEGPPRRSARDVMNAVEPSLEVESFTTTVFHEGALAWLCVSRRRKTPAQPSTRR